MKIVVGYDGSNVAKHALQLAIHHAKAFGAKVYVLTSFEKGTEDEVKDIEAAERGLEYAKSLFDENDIPCETHLLIRGLSPGEDLVQFARDKQVDEIIVGIRKRSQVGKILFGSTARYVITKAECPVVGVK
jgi:nucleotide-binding universal stress UspA family protein